MISQLCTMLEMQEAMNAKVNSDWRTQGFAWYRAIWTECAELMDHYGWKWWKKQNPDLDQVQLELVDIWHFGLSLLLLSGRDTGDLAAEVAQDLAASPREAGFREILEAFTLETLQTKNFSVPLFASLMAAANMSFEALYVRYMGKNVLNFFRQDNGYQQGSYIKTWQGREDNEHLVEIIADLDASRGDFKQQIYQSLQLRYSRARDQ